MNVNEIKSWAKARGFSVKKKGEGYVWWCEGSGESDPAPIEEVAKAIFNRLTDGRFSEYQKGFSS